MIFVNAYITAAVLVGILDIVIAVLGFNKKTKLGRYFGYICVCAAVIDVAYTLSVTTRSLMLCSVFSSIYFIGMDVILNTMGAFTVVFTRYKLSNLGKTLYKLSAGVMILDVISLATNPFTNIALSYQFRDTVIACYEYKMGILYYVHLGYTYILVIAILFLLVKKSISVAREYSMQYILTTLGILFLVAFNFTFLFTKELGVIAFLDYSILGYGIVLAFLYWCTFKYYKKGMMSNLKNSIFDNIDKGIVLFDYDDRVTLFNNKAKSLLSNIENQNNVELGDFLEKCDIKLNAKADAYSMQCYVKDENGDTKPLRCDYRFLTSKSNKTLGRLFVFTDAVMDTDLLTGFHNWDSFYKLSNDSPQSFAWPVAVSVCDIVGLSIINATYGKTEGDEYIKELSDLIRQEFPYDAFLVRGNDANIIVICRRKTEKYMVKCMSKVQEKFRGNMIFSVGHAETKEENILDIIYKTIQGMKTKKLLNKDSLHSSVLNSLISALKETDSDTEAHVKRTQELGLRLGKKLGLTHIQKDELSLLCIMHDIGKIGIPLEILNKPTKLTRDEWEIMKTHVEKSYQIALSSEEFAGIADAVKHHHERWDGKGYPIGLSRETIPLLSRVIAVIDAYDAMISKRVYKDAMSKSEALDELKKNAGTQFDPLVVSKFVHMIEEEEEIEAAAPKDGKSNSASEQSMSAPAIENSGEGDNEADLLSETTHPFEFCRYVLDNNNYIIEADDNFERFTGYTQEDIRKMHLSQIDLLPEKARTEYLMKLNEQLRTGHNALIEHIIQRKDGVRKYVICYGRQYYDPLEKVAKSEVVIADSAESYTAKMLASEEKQRAAARLNRWEHTYRKDSLTGLLSHAAFESDVELQLMDQDKTVILVMVDVDRFKEFNDTYGHRQGDEFLIMVANALDSSLRKGDQACRMGGDEFAAALYFNKGVSVEIIHNRVRQLFDTVDMTIRSAEMSTSVSMGVAIEDENLNTFNKLYDAADKALYKSKAQGRAKVSINSDSLTDDKIEDN